MKFIDVAKLRNRTSFRDWALILAGSIVLSAGFVLFMNPYQVIPGGVYGLGIVLHALYPGFKVGTYGLMCDIPLLLVGLRIFGRRFGLKTVAAALLTPLIMNTMTAFVGDDPAAMFNGQADLSNDMFLVCIFGGVLIGAGLGLILKTHATSGGTDIIAMLLGRYARMPFSRGVLLVDSLVVIFGMIVLADWRLPLYSLVTIFVSTRVIDLIVDGPSLDKLLFIISDNPQHIKPFIFETLNRGGTFVKTSGMYTGKNRDMIFLVVARSEVSRVKSTIREIDPGAFMVVVNAHETFGDGFKPFPETNL